MQGLSISAPAINKPYSMKSPTQYSERNCLTCNNTIRGRADKKFCNDYCRSTFNNKHDHAKLSHIRTITNTLLKNRKVLEKWAINRTTPVNLHELLSDGLNLAYFTHCINHPLGNPSNFCYDFGYQLLPNNQCRILTTKQ